MSLSRRMILILLAVCLLAGAATGEALYYQMAYLWMFLYLSSWVLSKYSLRGVSLARSSRTQRAQVGQIFEERYDLQNHGRFLRLWIEVRDESSLPGSEGSRILTLVNGKQGRSYLARTRLQRRGVFELGPTVLASSDIFGLFPVQKTENFKNSLLVYPLMFEIQEFPFPPGLLSGGDSLRRRTHQVTPNAAGVREYVHGDSLNRIHWLSSARRNQLMVKEFELDPMADLWIFLDAYIHVQQELPVADRSAHIDIFQSDVKVELPASTEEYSISTAASLARLSLRKGRAVGLVAAGHQLVLLPPDRGGRQLGKVLEALALLKARGTIPLRTMIETQVKHIARGSTVVLISPAMNRDNDVIVDFLVQRGLRPVFIFIDAGTFGGPHFDSAGVAFRFKAMGIPFRRIAYGMDLGAALSVDS